MPQSEWELLGLVAFFATGQFVSKLLHKPYGTAHRQKTLLVYGTAACPKTGVPEFGKVGTKWG